MKLCLISPSWTIANKKWRYPQIPPLGIAYLGASARRAGHDVTVIDALGEGLTRFHPFIRGCYVNGLSIKEIVQRVEPDTDAIGIGVMFSKQWPFVRRLLDALRQAFPDTPIIAGGEHVTAATEHVFESSPVDFAVLGEGEETLIELLDALSHPKDLSVQDIEGLAYRAPTEATMPRADGDTQLRTLEGGGQTRIVRNPARKRRRDLDSVPWPAWDLIPVHNYMEANRFQDATDRRVMLILGTRGCPYRCRFCSSVAMWTTRFFMREPRDIVDEMESYMRQYGATEFHFQDLTFVINRAWVMRVADEIHSRNLGIIWKLPSGTRSEAFDQELMVKLSDTGCTALSFAPESGSKRMLEVVQKQADPDRFIELGRIVRRNRIKLKLEAFLIIGFPEETLRDLWQTYVFIARLAMVGYDSVLCSRFTSYPGSDYHRGHIKSGLIEYNDEFFLDSDTGYSHHRRAGRTWHPRWSDRSIKRLITLAYSLFFTVYYLSRPLRMVKSVVAVLRNTPRTRIEVVFAHGLMRRVRRIAALLSGRRAARSI
ncbi:MAG: B12-binding domain-containing radical SAM protein [Planctomycetes bacterium]|nr:B12-binding domain-containing radical SAM protein [Planctomycetota bacterium]